MTRQQESRTEVHDGMRIEWDVPITMDDGTVLRCDVFRPNDEGKYPVIMGATPYGKLLSFESEVWGGQWKMLCAREPEILKLSSNRFQNYEFPDPERFVPDGYVLVRVDVRGTGRSPGFMDLLSTRETLDYYQCIEWAAAQPWSSGKVGLSGVSYLAMNQWQVAALRPPHLAAICAWEGCSDFYREFTRHGGIYSTFGDLWFNKYILPVQHGRGEHGWRSSINGEWVSGPQTLSDAELASNRMDWRTMSRANRFATDAFWSSRLPDFSQIETPLLSAANWGGHGLHLRGNIAGFERAGSSQKWLNFHCLEHWTEYYTREGIALQKRFLSHFLKGEDNGWGSEPRVVMQVRHPKASFGMETATDWPLPNTQWTRFLSRRRDIESRSRAVRRSGLCQVRRALRGADIPQRSAGTRAADHRPGGGQAGCLVVYRGCGSVPGPAVVHTRSEGDHIRRRAGPAYAYCTWLAASLGAQARLVPLAAVPALAQP